MTIAERIRALIERLAPEPVCDDCIVDRLDLSVRLHANRNTRALAGQGGFERGAGACSLCGTSKKVIRRTAA